MFFSIAEATILDILILLGSISSFLLVYFNIYEQNYKWVKIAIKSIFGINFLSTFYTIFANPGIPDRKYYSRKYIKYVNKEDKSKYTICKICNIITPKSLNTSHCSDCKICVINHDFHFDTFGKCIGKNNYYAFYISLITIPFYIVMIFITFLTYLIYTDEYEMEKRRQGRN